MKEMETKTQQKTRSKGIKIIKAVLNTIINVLIVMVLIVSILIAVLALTSKASGISTIFGYTIQSILSDSMKGGSPDGYEGGDFEHGDLMIAKATGFDESKVYNLGDIVTYTSRDIYGTEMLIVHRIVDIKKNSDGVQVYQTQGDNRVTSPAPDQSEVENYLTADKIGSVFYSDSYHGRILKGWGNALEFLQSQQGFFLVVLLPMIIFFMYALIRVVISATNYRKSRVEDEKKEAVDAAVAAALAEKESSDSGKEAAAPADMTPEQMEEFKKFLEYQKAQKAENAEESAEKTDTE